MACVAPEENMHIAMVKVKKIPAECGMAETEGYLGVLLAIRGHGDMATSKVKVNDGHCPDYRKADLGKEHDIVESAAKAIKSDIHIVTPIDLKFEATAMVDLRSGGIAMRNGIAAKFMIDKPKSGEISYSMVKVYFGPPPWGRHANGCSKSSKYEILPAVKVCGKIGYRATIVVPAFTDIARAFSVDFVEGGIAKVSCASVDCGVEAVSKVMFNFGHAPIGRHMVDGMPELVDVEPIRY